MQSTILSGFPSEKKHEYRVDIYPTITYIYDMKGINMQKTINKYQSKFDRLMQSIEKDKILKKMRPEFYMLVMIWILGLISLMCLIKALTLL